MYPSQYAARTWFRAQPSQHASGSFPPIQNVGLLDAAGPAAPHKHPKRSARRSADQHDNLQDSFSRLLDALDRETPRCAVAC